MRSEPTVPYANAEFGSSVADFPRPLPCTLASLIEMVAGLKAYKADLENGS